MHGYRISTGARWYNFEKPLKTFLFLCSWLKKVTRITGISRFLEGLLNIDFTPITRKGHFWNMFPEMTFLDIPEMKQIGIKILFPDWNLFFVADLPIYQRSQIALCCFMLLQVQNCTRLYSCNKVLLFCQLESLIIKKLSRIETFALTSCLVRFVIRSIRYIYSI